MVLVCIYFLCALYCFDYLVLGYYGVVCWLVWFGLLVGFVYCFFGCWFGVVFCSFCLLFACCVVCVWFFMLVVYCWCCLFAVVLVFTCIVI